MNTNYQITSQLLDYPETWINNNIPSNDPRISRFLSYARKTPIEELCQLYIDTFDFNKDTTMYLTYYQYQEQKERGEALVTIQKKYSAAGLYLLKELPDYLPVMLEFASINPTGQTLLEQYLPALVSLKSNLGENPYSLLIEAILTKTPQAVGEVQ